MAQESSKPSVAAAEFTATGAVNVITLSSESGAVKSAIASPLDHIDTSFSDDDEDNFEIIAKSRKTCPVPKKRRLARRKSPSPSPESPHSDLMPVRISLPFDDAGMLPLLLVIATIEFNVLLMYSCLAIGSDSDDFISYPAPTMQ